MSRYIYFGVGRSFGYMDQHMSSQVSAQVKPKGKKNWQADKQVPVWVCRRVVESTGRSFCFAGRKA